MNLVLSLFPGIGLLDMAFEEEGFCVVRGPDLLWGGDVRRFNPPAGKFDGVIGGPPCKRWSPLANVVRAVHGEDSVAPDLIPEFERVVGEAAPAWFIMENVERAPLPNIPGYVVYDEVLNNRWCGGEQNRIRRFSFGTKDGRRLPIETELFEPVNFKPAVTTNSGGRRKVIAFDANGRVRGKQGHSDDHRLKWRPLSEMAADQGLPAAFSQALSDHGAFTTRAIRVGIGNGVPLPMGRAIARAVSSALLHEEGRQP
jgi:DNA (cytosine-5)-methyltransferase 1